MGRSMCTVYDESMTHSECDSQTTPNDGRGPTDRPTDRPIDRSVFTISTSDSTGELAGVGRFR